jgi:hypothetical protein
VNTIKRSLIVTMIGLCLAPAGLPMMDAAGGSPSSTAATSSPARDYPVKPVPFTAVHFHDAFWGHASKSIER